MRLLGIILLLVSAAVIAPPAHAIIILPALILIPVIKIVAIVIGALSLPAAGLAAVWSKLFGKPLSEAAARAGVILLIIAVGLIIVLKLHTPGRPWI